MVPLMLLLILAPGLSGARAEFICAGAVAPAQPMRAAKPARTVQEGARRALVIFARFRDQEGGWREVPAWGQDLFAAEKPGSFSHFYDTMSFGRLQVRGEVAPRLYASAQPAAAYLAEGPAAAGRFGQFALEVLAQVDQEVDFAGFDDDGPDGVPDSGDDDGYADAIFLLLATTPAHFLIGPATGTGSLGFEGTFTTGDRGHAGAPIRLAGELGTIQQGPSFAEAAGAMCHEYGHVLGLPDLYDVGFLSRPGAPPSEDSAGIGAWGLMGWGALGWQGNDGPNSFCAWSRAQLGWSEVVEVDQQVQEIRLEDVGGGGKIIAVPLTDQERFLLEYRRRDGNYYDRHLPREGLLIWHVGGKEGNAVDLECADGRYLDADGDLDLLGGAPFALFLNSGDGFFVERTFKAGLPGFGVVADGDGFLDVGTAAGLFRNSGNRHHWLRVELAGAESNREGLGARLIVRAGASAQTRELGAGDGLTQDEGGGVLRPGRIPTGRRAGGALALRAGGGAPRDPRGPADSPGRRTRDVVYGRARGMGCGPAGRGGLWPGAESEVRSASTPFRARGPDPPRQR